MDIVLFGASGMIGSRVLRELVSRGHRVKAVARNTSRVAAHPGVTVAQCDMSDAGQVAATVAGTDAVVSAYSPGQGTEKQLLPAMESLVAGVKRAGVKRLLIVGGAASLHVAPGVTLLESGHLPAQFQAIAEAHADVLAWLLASDAVAELEWTNFSPAGFIEPGERTGKFRLGRNDLIVDAQGQSRISAEDYAIALVDELEKPQHVRERFTVGY